MPRLNLQTARVVEAAVAYALAALPQDAPQRPDWEKAYQHLHLRLDLAEQGVRYQKPKYYKQNQAKD